MREKELKEELEKDLKDTQKELKEVKEKLKGDSGDNELYLLSKRFQLQMLEINIKKYLYFWKIF